MTMAQQQLLLESRVVGVEGRLEAIETQLGDRGRKITADMRCQALLPTFKATIYLSKCLAPGWLQSILGEGPF